MTTTSSQPGSDIDIVALLQEHGWTMTLAKGQRQLGYEKLTEQWVVIRGWGKDNVIYRGDDLSQALAVLLTGEKK